jgi:hypothetical protein
MNDNIDEEFRGVVRDLELTDAAQAGLAKHMRAEHGVAAAAGPLMGVVELEALTAMQLFEGHDRLHEPESAS